jgi:hypothetical protein
MKNALTWLYLAFGLVGGLGVAGCAHGPALEAKLSFTQGPSLTISFKSTPTTNGVAREVEVSAPVP